MRTALSNKTVLIAIGPPELFEYQFRAYGPSVCQDSVHISPSDSVGTLDTKMSVSLPANARYPKNSFWSATAVCDHSEIPHPAKSPRKQTIQLDSHQQICCPSKPQQSNSKEAPRSPQTQLQQSKILHKVVKRFCTQSRLCLRSHSGGLPEHLQVHYCIFCWSTNGTQAKQEMSVVVVLRFCVFGSFFFGLHLRRNSSPPPPPALVVFVCIRSVPFESHVPRAMNVSFPRLSAGVDCWQACGAAEGVGAATRDRTGSQHEYHSFVVHL